MKIKSKLSIFWIKNVKKILVTSIILFLFSVLTGNTINIFSQNMRGAVNAEQQQITITGRVTDASTNESFTVNTDGTNLQRCFPESWRDVQGSYSDWLSDDELIISTSYSTPQGRTLTHRYFGYLLFNIDQQNYKLLGDGLLEFEGHATISPDQKWMLETRIYSRSDQNIYLIDMESNASFPLGKFVQAPANIAFLRSQIDCRWSPQGNLIGFNSAHSGKRQAYIFIK